VAAQSPSVVTAIRAFQRLESRLTRLPRLLVLGEFNSGKSALVNSLLGSGFVPGPITRKGRLPVLIRYNSQHVLIAVDVNGGRTPVDAETLSQWRGTPLTRIEAGLPSPLLRRIEILDLPGAAHPIHDIGELPFKASRNAHLALWCTSATQAWKGSEQRYWLSMPRRLRLYGVLAATHKDRLRIESDCEKVHMRLRKEAAPYFRNIVLFSSTKANLARDETLAVIDPDLWRESGADALHASLADALEALAAAREEVAQQVAQRIAARVVNRLQSLQNSSHDTSRDAAALTSLWTRQAEAMAARVTQETVRDMALLQEVARVIQGFGSAVLEPWLKQRPWNEASARLMALFRCETSMIAGAIEGLPPPAAVRRVHGALRQLHGELSDALATLNSAPPALQLPLADIHLALAPLLEAGRETGMEAGRSA
jgi:hypothetical protein